MSLLTRQPASATVVIAEDAELLVVRDPELQELGRRLPGLERNIISILASRLVRVNRLAVGDEPGRLIVLDDHGSPPLLGYALAASVAWHTRARTIHVELADTPPGELAALATLGPTPPFKGVRRPGAELLVSRLEGEFAPDRVEPTLLRLTDDYDFVFVPAGKAQHGSGDEHRAARHDRAPSRRIRHRRRHPERRPRTTRPAGYDAHALG
jgi:hypothetical protein